MNSGKNIADQAILIVILSDKVYFQFLLIENFTVQVTKNVVETIKTNEMKLEK